jgi:hypothetical protein
MDLKKYDKLRKKIDTKDFEGNNKGLDKWLYIFSFVGNIGSIFFSYFLVFPGLLKAISVNLIGGVWATILSLLFTIVFLTIFEVIKRYFIRSFSADYMAKEKKFKFKNISWLTVSIAIIILSFYLSLVGSKNLASTSSTQNTIAETEITTQQDSISLTFERQKEIYINDNEALRVVNIDLRQKLAETPVTYRTIRNDYQTSIDKNIEVINNNQTKIDEIDAKLQLRVGELKTELTDTKSENRDADTKNIVLFIIIAIFCEVIIIGGIYFREYFEYNLYILNRQKFEKIYLKKDRYRALLTYIYNNGNVNVGDRVISGLALKERVTNRTNIPNSNKMIDEFLHEMDKLGIFVTHGKRRHIAKTYAEAINILETNDDTLQVIENMI